MISADTRFGPRRYYTVTGAAHQLGVSKSTFQKWIVAKLVKVTLVGPPEKCLRRISIDEIERLQRTA